MPKFYIIAGEASGDLHGANLIKALKRQSPNSTFRIWGGDLMEAAGGQLVKHYRDLAFMGFIEVIMNLRTILKNIKSCKKDILEWKPDAIVLIDYPGFNMRIAAFAKAHGIPVHYYISPQIWAWKQGRVKQIKRDVDHMYVILPFEKPFYQKFGMDVHFVGHPLLDAINTASKDDKFRSKHALDDRPIIALIPGSRKQEILTMLPLMMSVKDAFSSYQFVVGGAPSQEASFYASIIGKNDVRVVYGDTYGLFQHAVAGLVTSGTATLESAIFGMPQVVCYKGSTISYQIAKRLVKVDYISLVNLVMDRPVVKELIQSELNTKNLQSELSAILPGGAKREQMVADMEALREKLGGSGASELTAELMLKTL